jgi:hypothetical protein
LFSSSTLNQEFEERVNLKPGIEEAFPNPQRIGCPADSDLARMAEHPTEADILVSQHLTGCCPCFNRYMELLADLRPHP